MRVICLILARHGSKRIQQKNLLIFKNKPLIYWTLKQSLRIANISKIILSSDSFKIIKIAKSISKKFIINKRTKKFSGSKTKSETVIKYLNNIYKFNNDDYILILQPTSPLRKDNDIINAIYLGSKYNLNTIHSGNIYKNKIKIKKKIFLYKSNRKKYIYQKKNYSYNGAIYFFKIKYFLDKKTVYEKIPNIYKMDDKNSLDIDTYKDLKPYNYKVVEN